MKSLFRFILRYHATFLFIILELICIALLVANNQYQRSVFASSSYVVISRIEKSWSVVTDYVKLAGENRRLAIENAALQNELQQRRAYNRSFVFDSVNPDYTFMNVTVINNSVNNVKNYITIDAGLKQGVRKEMGVIGPEGVAGIVYNCSDNFSTVLPVINTAFKLSVKISRNNYFGSLSWTGKSHRYARMSEIPVYIDIKVGDTVVTSGYSSIFPPDIPVGVVDSYKKMTSTGFYEIDVKLATNFANLKNVYVVKNLHKQEIEALEAQNDKQ
ncbi:MAG: rod shape-determining protein MreC [Bacteroidales bacterium]|mgnify:CR=1 FL=1|nr:rod shape-determining protein MreC [Bacteroidales bacterium]HOY38524.1 rod shape-determining protein MreC [Bacteroidales bacterium]